MIKFEYQYGPDHPKVTVELSHDASLTEVFEQFEAFLKAAGYVFNGEIDVVEPVENAN